MMYPGFQRFVDAWMVKCFGTAVRDDREERNYRFIEEALELIQACGCPPDRVHLIVDHVYSRDVGGVEKEVGDVMISLAALCNNHRVQIDWAAIAAMDSCEKRTEIIREKRAGKPAFLKGGHDVAL